MKVLLIGGGGREHALAWKIRQSPLVDDLYCAPGNPGIANIGTRVPIHTTSIVELADFAKSARVDLTVVGPELPLTLGISEEFGRRGLDLFGASAQAAMIESSKVFAKEFMRRHEIPTADWESFASATAARSYLDSKDLRYPVVVKADGLAAGKGVVVCGGPDEAREAVSLMMEARAFGTAGDRVVIEECLSGREVSFFAISDGARLLPLVTCQDYKRAFDGDTGPNTGGMGAYSPSVYVDQDTFVTVRDRVLAPTIAGLAAEDRPFRGVLYAGLMLTDSGPRVLEYNARFGDPEAQALLPRLASDLVPLLAAAASGRLESEKLAWRSESAVTVVLAADGYPGRPREGMPIAGIPQASSVEGVTVFQAGTAAGPEGETVVAGGRVLAVSALGIDLSTAAGRAYEAASRIRFDGLRYRTDICRDALAVLASRGPA